MQTVTMSLTEAFKLRQDLKRCISKNESEIRDVPAFYNPETDSKTHTTIRRKYGSIEDLMKLTYSEYTALGDLNTAIDRANVEVRPYLNKIESIVEEISLFESIQTKIDRTSSVSVESGLTERKVTQLTAEFTDDTVTMITNTIKESKREKSELEKKVSELNGATKLSVSFEDNVYNDVFNL